MLRLTPELLAGMKAAAEANPDNDRSNVSAEIRAACEAWLNGGRPKPGRGKKVVQVDSRTLRARAGKSGTSKPADLAPLDPHQVTPSRPTDVTPRFKGQPLQPSR
jgi:hypothetical protein